VLQRARVDAGHGDAHAVRVGPRGVEGGDAADLAEGVLGRVRAEGVGGDDVSRVTEPTGQDSDYGKEERWRGWVSTPHFTRPCGARASQASPACARVSCVHAGPAPPRPAPRVRAGTTHAPSRFSRLCHV
jgi:hypothetical protein